MTYSEAIVKLALASVVQFLAIGMFATAGFLLSYYLFKTPPMLTALITIACAVIGTVVAFLGIAQIIGHKHKDE